MKKIKLNGYTLNHIIKGSVVRYSVNNKKNAEIELTNDDNSIEDIEETLVDDVKTDNPLTVDLDVNDTIIEETKVIEEKNDDDDNDENTTSEESVNEKNEETLDEED